MQFSFRIKFTFLTLAAAAALIVLAAGCGGSTSAASPRPTPTPGASPTPLAVPSPSPTPAPSPSPTPAATASVVPHSSHVVLVIEENHTFAQTLSSMPWLTSMGSKYAFAVDYKADEPGSLLDYLWLSSGSGEHAFGCQGGGCPAPITDNNIFRELANAGVSWKVYAEGLPSAGYMGPDTGAYVVRHNPARWYSDVINSPALQQNMVPFTEFAKDLAANQLPAYSIIVPDVTHDAHDGTLAQADTWLQSNVAPLLNQPSFQPGGDGLMIVTFDECDAAIGACNEQVYTAVMGPRVKPHFQSALPYRHENALRTILDALGVPVYPGASATAADMSDFFQ